MDSFILSSPLQKTSLLVSLLGHRGSEQSGHLPEATGSIGARRWAVGKTPSIVDPRTKGQEATRMRKSQRGKGHCQATHLTLCPSFSNICPSKQPFWVGNAAEGEVKAPVHSHVTSKGVEPESKPGCPTRRKRLPLRPPQQGWGSQQRLGEKGCLNH